MNEINTMPLTLDVTSMHTTLTNDVELVSALHNQVASEEFPSSAYLRHVLHTIASVAVVISFLYYGIVRLLKTTLAKKLDLQKERIYQVAYQATNLSVNLTLGLYGIYHYNATVPLLSTLSVTQRITGFDQYVNFACLQIGYNIWAIPVGIFIVKESRTMLVHHIATICVSGISTSSITGFRYHTPFFFGLIEISSVPLAIVNYCKDNKQWAETNIPTVSALIKPIFAIMFLSTRVIMWTPNIYDVLRNCAILIWTCESLSTKFGMSVFFVAVVFLTSLQYYWGVLVVQGLIKIVEQVRVKKVPDVKKVE